MLKSIPINLKNTLIVLFHTKNNFLKVIICIKIIISIIPFYTKNNFKKYNEHKNHLITPFYTNDYRKNIIQTLLRE